MAPAGSVYVSGHSAGGHLTAMAMAALFPAYARDLPRRVVRGGLAISGVYDLRPLRDRLDLVVEVEPGHLGIALENRLDLGGLLRVRLHHPDA